MTERLCPMKKQQRCYIYTRVSTSMQVDGYSLDAFNGKEIYELDWDNESIVEACVLLEKTNVRESALDHMVANHD